MADILGMGHDHEPASRADPRVFTFAFVRNPYARLWSAWQFVQVATDMAPKCTFKEFTIDGSTEDCEPFFRPMHWFIDRPISFVGRFESLQSDFDRLMQILGKPRQVLPVVNSSSGPSWQDTYTPEMKRAVYSRSELDFTRFAYGA